MSAAEDVAAAGKNMNVMVRTAIYTFMGFITFWISLGLFAGAPWDGVLLACIITAICMPPLYWYGRWLQRRLARGDSNGDERGE